ncbi:isochorismatase family protein [Lysinibacillus xylanilyticus]|uniref:isochorismatase family protein n=1 Tax=Lysinibacillus xylanilyticus TaxID=582475 RepID=UPI002B243348|nr:isochorismatase family protein [Lysinibacillus xylanilyticus]
MKQALMVLDIQNDFLSNQARIPVANHQIELILKGINDLIRRAEKPNVPILYIRKEFE